MMVGRVIDGGGKGGRVVAGGGRVMAGGGRGGVG